MLALLFCTLAAPPAWQSTELTDAFTAEGAASADFDGDGHVDLLVGPFLYLGPDWLTRREVSEPRTFAPTGYSETFLQFAADLSGDGWPDAVRVGWPGKETVWYENPAGPRDWTTAGHWTAHLLAPVVDNESPLLADLVGDERPELIAQLDGAYGYFAPAGADPRGRWRFTPVSDADPGRGKYTHGLGVGDLNGDGRADLLTKDGWYAQPADLTGDPPWEEHAVPFAGRAAQILVLDADGDGDGDVFTARDAHGYGLDWWEQTDGGDAGGNGPKFVRHVVMGDAGSNPAPLLFTQPHALTAADVNGDGLTDVVTGKRFWAHGPKGDADPSGTPVLVWWELTRPGGGVRFVPHVIHDASGVGTQVHAADLTGDGKTDVLTGNKRGAWVHVQTAAPASTESDDE